MADVETINSRLLALNNIELEDFSQRLQPLDLSSCNTAPCDDCQTGILFGHLDPDALFAQSWLEHARPAARHCIKPVVQLAVEQRQVNKDAERDRMA